MTIIPVLFGIWLIGIWAGVIIHIDSNEPGNATAARVILWPVFVARWLYRGFRKAW